MPTNRNWEITTQHRNSNINQHKHGMQQT